MHDALFLKWWLRPADYPWHSVAQKHGTTHNAFFLCAVILPSFVYLLLSKFPLQKDISYIRWGPTLMTSFYLSYTIKNFLPNKIMFWVLGVMVITYLGGGHNSNHSNNILKIASCKNTNIFCFVLSWNVHLMKIIIHERENVMVSSPVLTSGPYSVWTGRKPIKTWK